MEVILELLSTFVRVLVVEILFGTIFYWIGWGVCKAVTFGKYPDSLQPSNGEKKDTLVFIVGLLVCLGIFLCFIYWG